MKHARRVLPSLLALVSCTAARPAPAPDPPALSPAPLVETSPPPSAPAPAPATPLATADSPPIGTAHPYIVMSADPSARWVALCQARQDTDKDGTIEVGIGHHGDMVGDAMTPFLVLGSGDGEPIDDLVTSDERGDHLLYVKAGRLHLLDAATGQREDLSARGADASDDNAPFGGHRAGSIDRAGRRLLYRKVVGKRRAVVVVRDLQTGAEIELDPGPGLLHRASLSGNWAVMQVIHKDTDGNGKLEPPVVRTSLGGRRCRGPIMSYSTWGMDGDRPELRVAPATGGPARPEPGLILPIRDLLLVREASGALVARRTDGSSAEWVPAACKGRLLAAAPDADRVLVACAAPDPRKATLAVHGPGLHHPFPDTTEVDPDDDDVQLGRLALYYTRDGHHALDLVALTERALPPDHHFVASHEQRLLLGNTKGPGPLVVQDHASGDQKLLVGDVAPHGDSLQQGPLVTAPPLLVDLAHGAVVGRLDGEPHALATDGRVLVPATPSARGQYHTTPSGPLLWRAPRPPGP